MLSASAPVPPESAIGRIRIAGDEWVRVIRRRICEPGDPYPANMRVNIAHDPQGNGGHIVKSYSVEGFSWSRACNLGRVDREGPFE